MGLQRVRYDLVMEHIHFTNLPQENATLNFVLLNTFLFFIDSNTCIYIYIYIYMYVYTYSYTHTCTHTHTHTYIGKRFFSSWTLYTQNHNMYILPWRLGYCFDLKGFWGLFTLKHITLIHLFSWLPNTVLCEYINIYLSVALLIYI